MNEELRLKGEPVEEMPQCLEPCLSKEQKDERRKIEILKNWEIGIQVFNRGCVVKIGCKSFAFTSLEAGYKEIGRYLEDPQLVATQHGFGDYC